jgi:hypothetical protein
MNYKLILYNSIALFSLKTLARLEPTVFKRQTIRLWKWANDIEKIEMKVKWNEMKLRWNEMTLK